MQKLLVLLIVFLLKMHCTIIFYRFQATIKHTEGYYWIFRKGTDYGRDYDASQDNKGHFNYPDDRLVSSYRVRRTFIKYNFSFCKVV